MGWWLLSVKMAPVRFVARCNEKLRTRRQSCVEGGARSLPGCGEGFGDLRNGARVVDIMDVCVKSDLCKHSFLHALVPVRIGGRGH